MKHLYRAIIALVLALLMATLLPAQVFADTPDYISEVKIGIGSTSQLEKEGYTILKGSNNKPVDLNDDAGGGIGSHGDEEVYLGYKTTADKNEAITDLALMNMKGGYSVKDYELLMQSQMESQIIPFADSFLTAIEEYRENYASDMETNQQRAQYVHDALNKLTDDDCGGAGLGDLLLNETVYEMAKPQYDALSDKEKQKTSFAKVNEQVRDALPEAEKNQHADILTILAQSNGRATLLFENLITKATDTNEETWIDRFVNTSYDDLVSVANGKTAADKQKSVAKEYDDDANELLDMWEAFREQLLEADEAAEELESMEVSADPELTEQIEGLDKNSKADEILDVLLTAEEAQNEMLDTAEICSEAALSDYLEDIEYGDGTLLDFFMQSAEEIADDITVLYPLIASLTEGQRAGLEFVSLREIVVMAEGEGAFEDETINELETASIYDGVDRGIYEKGGVALTSDALRADAETAGLSDDASFSFSTLTIIMYSLTALSAVGFAASVVAKVSAASKVSNAYQAWAATQKAISAKAVQFNTLSNQLKTSVTSEGLAQYKLALREMQAMQKTAHSEQHKMLTQARNNSTQCNKLMIGMSIVVVVLTAISVYLTWKDMQAQYDVDFSPIPHYMVDEKDLIGYNKKGERVILKNQSAYYKAVESTMKKGDFKYDEIGNLADMNGCVGKQWLALYAVKNEAEDPITASSLKVVVGSKNIPADYTTGIHMFGSGAAFNLNSDLYVWNDDADSIYVYFKRDEGAKVSTTGANATYGTVAVSGGCGLLLGIAGSALCLTISKKRKENKTNATA